MSPLLFLLVIKGLSQMILEAKVKGKFSSLKIYSSLKITHILIVDGMAIFGSDKIEDWKVLYDILKIFCSVSGMEIHQEKYLFYQNKVSDGALYEVTSLYQFKVEGFEMRFKYIGFLLQLNKYIDDDWSWLVKEIKRRIINWD